MTTRGPIFTVGRQGRFVLVADESGDYPGARTITNAAEDTVAQLARRFPDLAKLVVLYRDTDGHWDRLLVGPDGTFAGFTVFDAQHTTAEAAMEEVGQADMERCFAAISAATADFDRETVAVSLCSMLASIIDAQRGDDDDVSDFVDKVAAGMKAEIGDNRARREFGLTNAG
jgi:hypothetical protein